MAIRNAQDGSSSISTRDGESNRGMVLPFQPLSLAFNHVNYYVDMPAVSVVSSPTSNLSLSRLAYENRPLILVVISIGIGNEESRSYRRSSATS